MVSSIYSESDPATNVTLGEDFLVLWGENVFVLLASVWKRQKCIVIMDQYGHFASDFV